MCTLSMTYGSVIISTMTSTKPQPTATERHWHYFVWKLIQNIHLVSSGCITTTCFEPASLFCKESQIFFCLKIFLVYFSKQIESK